MNKQKTATDLELQTLYCRYIEGYKFCHTSRLTLYAAGNVHSNIYSPQHVVVCTMCDIDSSNITSILLTP